MRKLDLRQAGTTSSTLSTIGHVDGDINQPVVVSAVYGVLYNVDDDAWAIFPTPVTLGGCGYEGFCVDDSGCQLSSGTPNGACFFGNITKTFATGTLTWYVISKIFEI